MSEFKGTKGKWEFDCDEYADTADVWNGKGENIISYQGHNTERVYDFLLMSKSKEMLQALITTLEELECINVLENHRNYIRQLIKQATEI